MQALAYVPLSIHNTGFASSGADDHAPYAGNGSATRRQGASSSRERVGDGAPIAVPTSAMTNFVLYD
ncbi:hypothetical protein CLV84_0814 [Neolewinella xylanilytica]|uniref:Uncharacterized protein n=1 Tax=Neolewinella xylanilytica TaxID=1514080 RepID=A0A2S6I8P1_9BACT|nr:hypothetical protein CLV84_0814 [Neolewinella xylanilytica]